VLSVTFAAYSNGTFAYNSANSSWRQINPAIPMAMDEGSDGTLFASYANSGTWRYDYGNNNWTKLTPATTSILSVGSSVGANTFYGSYGNGTWEYDTATYWTQLSPVGATHLAAVGFNNVYASFSNGTSHYTNQGWQLITAAVPSVMAATQDGALYASYNGSGTWEYGDNESWSRLTTAVATQLTAVTGNQIPTALGFQLYATFANGTFGYNAGLYSGGWRQLTGNVASQIGIDADYDTLIASFSYGTYTFDGTGWHLITTAQAILVD
jgi:hypothetical protein